MEKYLKYIRSYFPFNNKLVYTEDYYNTIETKDLILISKKFLDNKGAWPLFFQKVSAIFEKKKCFDSSFKYEGNFSRCYSCSVVLEDSSNYTLILELCISFIGPYYHLVVLEFEKDARNKWNGRSVLHYDFYKFNIQNEVAKISHLIENDFGVTRIPDNEAFIIIPSIYFESVETDRFCVYNAFFYNAFYVRL